MSTEPPAGAIHARRAPLCEVRRSRRRSRRDWREQVLGGVFAVCGLLAAALPSIPARADALRTLPRKFQQAPYSLMSLSVGYPNGGWQLRAKRVRRSKQLSIKAGSEERVYGHPALVLMLKRSAQQVARGAPGSVMLVGDLSDSDGGFLAGHTSHQSGRDADIGFYVTDRRGRAVTLERFVAFGGNGKALDGSGLDFDDWRNWLLLQAWAKDDRAGLSHIFVASRIRQRLLGWAEARPAFRKHVSAVAALLKQPENASAHDDHFHVRISCPADQDGICREQSR